uniref:SCP domain-containing protein n=1 Tax=Mesocestoides corti TaxID=53468 RepID=A0A5K3F7T4_MESCO
MKQLIFFLVMTSTVMSQAPSQEERNGILEFHTKAREKVNPTASNMRMMSYSEELEKLAIDWVARCEMKHPDDSQFPAYKGIGQNLAMMAGLTPTLAQMAQGWYNEIVNYTYADNSCKHICGHYTQMVWATSSELGCAKKQCDSSFPSSPKPVYVMACQYKPAGNMNGQKPYLEGRSCSMCQDGDVCNRNQCAKTSAPVDPSVTISTTSVSSFLSASETSLIVLFSLHALA